MQLRAHRANLKIVEVPSIEYRRIYGKSNLRVFRDGWRVMKMIVKEWANGHSVIRAARMDRSNQQDVEAQFIEPVYPDGLTVTEKIGATQ